LTAVRAWFGSTTPVTAAVATLWASLALSQPMPVSLAIVVAPLALAAVIHSPRLLIGAILVGIPLGGATRSVAGAAVVGYALPLLLLSLWAVRAAMRPEPLPRLPRTLAWWFPAWMAWVVLCASASAFPMAGFAEAIRFLLLALTVTAIWHWWDRGAMATMHLALCAVLFGLALQGLSQILVGVAPTWHGSVGPGRWSGLFENPNTYGFFMALGFVIAAAWVLAPRPGSLVLARGLGRLAVTLVALVLLAACITSFSRGGLMFAAVAGLTLTTALPRLRWWVLSAAGGFAVWALVTAPPWILLLGRISSGLSQRDALWRVALGIIRDHPFLGVGSGNDVFEIVRRRYLESTLTRELFYVDAGGAHNVFLTKAAELGIVGLVLTLVVFGFGLARVPLALRRFREGDWFAGFLAAAMVAIAAHGMIEIGQTLGHGRITGALPFFVILLGLEAVRRDSPVQRSR